MNTTTRRTTSSSSSSGVATTVSIEYVGVLKRRKRRNDRSDESAPDIGDDSSIDHHPSSSSSVSAEDDTVELNLVVTQSLQSDIVEGGDGDTTTRTDPFAGASSSSSSSSSNLQANSAAGRRFWYPPPVTVIEDDRGGIIVDFSNFSGRLRIEERVVVEQKDGDDMNGAFVRKEPTSVHPPVSSTFPMDTADERPTGRTASVLSVDATPSMLEPVLPPLTTTDASPVLPENNRSGLTSVDGWNQGGDRTSTLDLSHPLDDSSMRQHSEENTRGASTTDPAGAIRVDKDVLEDGNEEFDDSTDGINSQSAEHQNASIQLFLASLSPSGRDTDGATPMHRLVGSKDLTVNNLQELVDQWSDMATVADSSGRLPLHVLGNNSDLLSTAEGQMVARQCGILLMERYPQAIVHADSDNHMPFIRIVHKWVEWTHLQHIKGHNVYEGKSYGMKGAVKTIAGVFSGAAEWESPKLFKSKGQLARHAESSADVNASNYLIRSNNRFPPVIIFEQVEWSFRMLSLAMDYLAGYSFDQTKRGRPLLSYHLQRQNRGALAQNLVAIPQVFKTIMLVESSEVRQEIMTSSIVRRAMLCRESMGPWLTGMLRHKKGNISSLAIDYIEVLSTLTVVDYIGVYRKPLPKDIDQFKADKLEVYQQAEGLLDIIPSLLVLESEYQSRAVSMPLIWYIMNRKITTPYTVGMTVTEFQVHFSLIVAVRDVSFGVYESGQNWLAAKLVIACIALYQVMRRIMELVILYNISSKVARKYCLNFWNLADLIGIVGALLSALLEKGLSPVGAALVLGLLWFRVLGFLKVVNEQLATFIVALKQIFYDIRFFCLVFVILIATFGDMLHMIFLNDERIDCSDPDIGDPGADFCSTNLVDSYLRTYAIVIGDFELADYQVQNSVIFFWVCLTFLGTVVLLNVLIAVVVSSYDGSQQSSIILFRKSRAEFVVSHVASERFLRPKTTGRQGVQTMSVLLLRIAFVAAFLITVILSCSYMIVRIIVTSSNVSFVSIIVMTCISCVLLYSLWAIFMFLLQYLVQRCVPQSDAKTKIQRFFDSINAFVVRILSSTMFGIDVSDTEGGEVIAYRNESNGAEVLSRMDKMEVLLDRTLKRLEADDAGGLDPHDGIPAKEKGI